MSLYNGYFASHFALDPYGRKIHYVRATCVIRQRKVYKCGSKCQFACYCPPGYFLGKGLGSPFTSYIDCDEEPERWCYKIDPDPEPDPYPLTEEDEEYYKTLDERAPVSPPTQEPKDWLEDIKNDTNDIRDRRAYERQRLIEEHRKKMELEKINKKIEQVQKEKEFYEKRYLDNIERLKKINSLLLYPLIKPMLKPQRTTPNASPSFGPKPVYH